MEIRQTLNLASVFLLLVISNSFVTGTSPDSNCPVSCICDDSISHAKCTSLVGLIVTNRTDLQSLDLSQNGLRRITSHLERFTSLQKLDLSHNRLSEVNKLPKGITELNLSHNRITSAKLSKIPKSVEKLNLSNNHITYVPMSLRTLKNLKSIDLGNNPINCTCETLAVRNWLTTPSKTSSSKPAVWSEVVTCAAPLQYKGMPWLAVKQADVCEWKVDNLTASVPAPPPQSPVIASKYNWDEIEKDNELMQGDQPAEGSGDDEYEIVDDYENDEGDDEVDDYSEPKTAAVLTKPDTNDDNDDDDIENEDLIVVKEAHEDHHEHDHHEHDHHEHDHSNHNADADENEETHDVEAEPVIAADEDIEGSGDDDVPIPPVPAGEGSGASSPSPNAAVEDDEEGDDVEGDESSGTPVSPAILPDVLNPGEVTESTDDLYYPEEDTQDASSTAAPTLGTLGIFGVGVEVSTAPSDDSAAEDEDATIAPVPKMGDAVETVAPPIDGSKSNVQQAKTDDNTNTFILLGILGVLLIGLMIYVAMKDKKSTRNRKGPRDIENTPATELQDMVKKNPNQPNGRPEHVPLITNGDKPNGNGKPFPAVSPNRIDEEEIEEPPHLETFKPTTQHQVPVNNVPNGNHHAPSLDNNNTTEYPTQNGDIPDVHKTPNKSDDDSAPAVNQPKRYSPVYSPRTPKLDRYSPVYTPEGRVKIKLTETPKPKTPIMVSRTRSRAGEYTITPEVIIDPVPANNKEEVTH